MRVKLAILAGAMTIAGAAPAWAEDRPDQASDKEEIVVTGALETPVAGTKTATPLIETPQPIAIVTEDQFRAQGAVSISDTLNYVAGVTANTYGNDSRVDGGTIRGLDPLQFRDGMRDLFSYYASIRSDPYNFSRIEVVRGPASVLFGQGSLGGIINMVSKTPEFDFHGEAQLVYGSFDRKEAMVDVTGPLSDSLAVRLVGRLRDADTQVDHVPDDRVMIAPSVTWRPGANTEITLIGLYQEDDGGSTAQFLPVVGTLFPNGSNPRLPNDTFIGKPGWDRYDGRLLQGTAILNQQLSDKVKLSVKARYIDSDLNYFTHYPDSYANPIDPYVAGSNGRVIGLYSDGSIAGMNVFSSDSNLLFKFNTGSAIEHSVLAGFDYSWSKVTKRGGYGYEFIDIYDIDYDALTLPTLDQYATEERQEQVGVYIQDQIRMWDRVSVVVGARRDNVRSEVLGSLPQSDSATTFRAGIIGEVGANLSPFFSYTESFQPVAGIASNGLAFRPQRGSQYEVGIKWQPNAATLVTVTGFRIDETGRPVDDPSTADPFDQMQTGKLRTKGIEVEAIHRMPGKFDIIVNYGYNKVTSLNTAFDYLPRHNASVWATRTIDLSDRASVRIGGGVRYTGKSFSTGFGGYDPVTGDPFNWTIVTPDRTLVDALVSLTWDKWSLSVNATNLLGEKFYASCLARGDCFIGAERNIMGTLAYRF